MATTNINNPSFMNHDPVQHPTSDFLSVEQKRVEGCGPAGCIICRSSNRNYNYTTSSKNNTTIIKSKEQLQQELEKDPRHVPTPTTTVATVKINGEEISTVTTSKTKTLNTYEDFNYNS